MDAAVDARHELSGEKGNILQYVWSRMDPRNGRTWMGIAHRRVPTEEREREPTRFLPTDITVAQGQSAVLLGQLGYLFGGDVPTATDRIWRYDPQVENLPPQDTGHRLIWPVAYSAAVSVGPAAYIFWGRTAGREYVCVQRYDGSGDPYCPQATETRFRYGHSAVYDGTRYVYIFGGIDFLGNYMDTITRWDKDTELEAGWGTCTPPTLPYGIAFGSAVWHPGQGVAYLFGGERAGASPGDPPRNSFMVWRFDPENTVCPSSPQTVSAMPCAPWDFCGLDDGDLSSVRPGPGTAGFYVGSDVILLLGGRHLYPGGTFAGSRYIWAFWTLTYTWGVKYVDLPACKSFGSGVLTSGRLYYFAGYKDPDANLCAAGGNQVVRYDLGTH